MKKLLILALMIPGITAYRTSNKIRESAKDRDIFV